MKRLAGIFLLLFSMDAFAIERKYATGAAALVGSDTSVGTMTATACLRTPADGTTFKAGCDGSTNTGVGTASPAAKLDVNGNAQFGTTAKSTFSTTGALTLAVDLAVTEGGTGASTLTDGGILFGNGASAIGATGVLTNGQLLIGDGTEEPTAAALTATALETEITNGAGSITVGIPDSIAVTSTLTVRGNAFSVGGSTLSVSNGLVGIGIASPCSTCTLHVAGNISITGTTNLVTSSAAISVTAFTAVEATVFSGCRSTVTIATSGGNVFVNWDGHGKGSVGDVWCGVWILQDGAYINGADAAAFANVASRSQSAGTAAFSISYHQPVSAAPASGSHSYCYGAADFGVAGVCTIGDAQPTVFSAYEIK